jgi:hypothetical protein
MLSQVQLLDDMDESMWLLLQRNLVTAFLLGAVAEMLTRFAECRERYRARKGSFDPR